MTIIGWKWSFGKLSILPHKITPLISSNPPPTCTTMHSYIGAYKAMSKCIPKYSSIIAPLEDMIKGMEKTNNINWTPERLSHFHHSPEALKDTSILTIPTY